MEDCLARVGLHHAEGAAVRLEDAQRAGMAVEGGLERAGRGRRAGRIEAHVEEDVEVLVKTLGAGQLQDGVEIGGAGGTGAEAAYVGPELSQLGGVVRAVWFCPLQQGTQAILKKGLGGLFLRDLDDNRELITNYMTQCSGRKQSDSAKAYKKTRNLISCLPLLAFFLSGIVGSLCHVHAGEPLDNGITDTRMYKKEKQ
jgi:hypothetical protein